MCNRFVAFRNLDDSVDNAGLRKVLGERVRISAKRV